MDPKSIASELRSLVQKAHAGASNSELASRLAEMAINLENPGADQDILHEAHDLTTGDRQNQYGPPTQDFSRTAAMWSGYLEHPIKPRDVAWMMILLKASRARWSGKRDHYVDAAGYARCGWLCVEEEDQ